MANHAQNPDILLNQDKPFVMMPVEVYKRTNDGNAIKLLLYLTDRINREKQSSSWPSYKTISKDLGMGRTTVSEKIKHLIKVGLLKVASGSRTKSNNYTPLRYFRNQEVVLKQDQGSTETGPKVVLKQDSNKNHLSNNDLIDNHPTTSGSPSGSLPLLDSGDSETDPNQTDLMESPTEQYIKELNEAYEKTKQSSLHFGPGTIQPEESNTPLNPGGNRESKQQKKDELRLVFEQSFWQLYRKSGKSDKKRCFDKWKRLSKRDRAAILIHVPKFMKAYETQATEDKYRKNPLTYLNGEIWKEEPEVSQIDQEVKNINPHKLLDIQSWIAKQNESREFKTAFWAWFQKNSWSKNINLPEEWSKFRNKGKK